MARAKLTSPHITAQQIAALPIGREITNLVSSLPSYETAAQRRSREATERAAAIKSVIVAARADIIALHQRGWPPRAIAAQLNSLPSIGAAGLKIGQHIVRDILVEAGVLPKIAVRKTSPKTP
jgi:hypothetical protein